jgi:type I restriction-modification system DNA methylase subunit
VLQANQLKSALWDAADTLRGSAVDRTDWKAYILPLLFFKRISDVWDEETAEATELYGDVDPAEFPEVHRFTVPEGCHWRDILKNSAKFCTALPLYSLHRLKGRFVSRVTLDIRQDLRESQAGGRFREGDLSKSVKQTTELILCNNRALWSRGGQRWNLSNQKSFLKVFER